MSYGTPKFDCPSKFIGESMSDVQQTNTGILDYIDLRSVEFGDLVVLGARTETRMMGSIIFPETSFSSNVWLNGWLNSNQTISVIRKDINEFEIFNDIHRRAEEISRSHKLALYDVGIKNRPSTKFDYTYINDVIDMKGEGYLSKIRGIDRSLAMSWRPNQFDEVDNWRQKMGYFINSSSDKILDVYKPGKNIFYEKTNLLAIMKEFPFMFVNPNQYYFTMKGKTNVERLNNVLSSKNIEGVATNIMSRLANEDIVSTNTYTHSMYVGEESVGITRVFGDSVIHLDLYGSFVHRIIQVYPHSEPTVVNLNLNVDVNNDEEYYLANLTDTFWVLENNKINRNNIKDINSEIGSKYLNFKNKKDLGF